MTWTSCTKNMTWTSCTNISNVLPFLLITVDTDYSGYCFVIAVVKLNGYFTPGGLFKEGHVKHCIYINEEWFKHVYVDSKKEAGALLMEVEVITGFTMNEMWNFHKYNSQI